MNIELGSDEQRFLPTASGHWRDLFTGRLIPRIEGSDGEDDEGEGADDDDGDDDGEEELSRLQAEMTKQNRAGGKKAVRELARKYGFGSRAELEAFLAERAADSDDDDKDDDGAPPARDEDSGRPAPVRSVPVENDLVRQRELRLEVREALAELDVVPSKAKLATATVVGLIDLTDPDLDADDIAEAVEDMKTSEPGWFLDSGGGEGSGSGRAVPGSGGRKPRNKPTKSPDEIAAEIYEQRKKARQPRRRLVGGSTQ
jgi:hypothetical protein